MPKPILLLSKCHYLGKTNSEQEGPNIGLLCRQGHGGTKKSTEGSRNWARHLVYIVNLPGLVLVYYIHMFLKSELSWTIRRVVCGIGTRTNQNASFML